MRSALAALLLLLTTTIGAAETPEIPFAAALDEAAISVERLDSILEYALLVGNGDVNGLLYSEGGQLKMMLTKNDVWDARYDAALDPPLPKIEWLKRHVRGATPSHGSVTILEDGWGTHGADGYHAHAYPCPRACGQLTLGRGAAQPVWRAIRAQGRHNGWESRDGVAVMSIAGAAGASNGYALGPLDVATDRSRQLHVTLSGSENAQFFIDVMGPDGKVLLGTGWQPTPQQPKQFTFDLPAGERVAQLILYTWTNDGQRAENRFERLELAGPEAQMPIDLTRIVATTTSARLDLRRGVAEVAGRDDGLPRAAVRVLADRNVVLIESPVAAQLNALPSADLPAAEQDDVNGVQWIEQTIPGDADWPGMQFAVAAASHAGRTAVAIVTSREAARPRDAAIALAKETLQQASAALVAEHEARWQRFWSASGVRLADADLQRAWYRNLYFLRCVTKPGVMPPGLFASLTTDHPAWHGDYHTNYNIQQTFWSAYVTNHPELAEPYDRLIADYLPRAGWLSRQVYDMDGAFYPHVIFGYEPPDPAKCRSANGRQYLHHVWGFTLGVSGFTVQPLWWHYKYAPDRQLLEQTVYPPVREVARFYANLIDRCPGDKLVELGPTVSPEHWGWTKNLERNRNCAFDIAMCRFTLQAAIEAATTLDCDAELVAHWRAALRRLPPYPTTEGESPVVVDVLGAPPITYNIAVPATPVFPGDVVGWWSPAAERELFTRTTDTIRWNGNNSMIMLAVARARLGMPETDDWLRGELLARTRPNGTLTLNRLGAGFNNFGHYTEQFAASMAVSELLLQSVGDVVRLMPAWPKEQDAEFRNLRTQGGFLVSAAQRDGRIADFGIRSTVGGTLRIASPWPTIRAKSPDASPVALRPDAQGIVEIDTKPGQRVILLPGK